MLLPPQQPDLAVRCRGQGGGILCQPSGAAGLEDSSGCAGQAAIELRARLRLAMWMASS